LGLAVFAGGNGLRPGGGGGSILGTTTGWGEVNSAGVVGNIWGAVGTGTGAVTGTTVVGITHTGSFNDEG